MAESDRASMDLLLSVATLNQRKDLLLPHDKGNIILSNLCFFSNSDDEYIFLAKKSMKDSQNPREPYLLLTDTLVVYTTGEVPKCSLVNGGTVVA